MPWRKKNRGKKISKLAVHSLNFLVRLQRKLNATVKLRLPVWASCQTAEDFSHFCAEFWALPWRLWTRESSPSRDSSWLSVGFWFALCMHVLGFLLWRISSMFTWGSNCVCIDIAIRMMQIINRDPIKKKLTPNLWPITGKNIQWPFFNINCQ